ncbi:hypothetical protein [Sinosporangium siamense]|uniref:Uncharacterized protein n=1 Tax=Sinosporangium siamense TaxID=1367973 RepID=A0A919RQ38_9ACTN|nr:hypothetical protein [Sinosporangium siamense]GII97212.1 hypothetical protein Ssi02_74430 [Sinosporangium siamense]
MLTRVLKFDALLCAVFGVLLAVAAGPVADLFGLPVPFVRWTGIILLPLGAFIGFVATRPQHPRGAVWTIVALNALWAVDSVVLLFTGWIDPNVFGVVFIVAQALLVAAVAEMQVIGLRRVNRVLA